jgi:ABC-type transporter Mla maintaining outer membrane lipid asymmetry ATPase subunit MlaF
VTDAPAIDIEGLVKDYGGLRPLRLRRLTVARAERVALSGLDATAAEVLVNIVNGAILPDAGEVRVFGRPTSAIANEDEWFASLDRFGIVTPRAVLLEASSVQQNLALPFTIDIDRVPEAVQEKTRALAAEVGLAEANLPARVDAFGQDVRMRVHLARAMASDPEVLLLEHPTAPIARDEVPALAETIVQLAGRRALTILAVTEDGGFADVVATVHYRLQGGTGALVSARGWRRWL